LNRPYYIVLIKTMSMNIILFVPHILISERFRGAIPSLFLSVPLSILLLYGFTRVLQRFPEEGAPEILSRLLPDWLLRPYMVLYGVMILCAGLFIIVAFSTIILEVIFPDMPYLLILVALCATISFGATCSTAAVVACTEIILLLNIPLVLIILLKAIFSPQLSMDTIGLMSDYVFVRPSLKSLAAATGVFSGYTSLGIVNRLQMQGTKPVHYGLIAFSGLLVLLVSFFVPIGFQGAIVGVDRFEFPWVQLSDSLRMPYGVIERVMFLFLLLFLNLSLSFSTFTWHVSIELIKSGLVRNKLDAKGTQKPGLSWTLALALSTVTILFAVQFPFDKTLAIVSLWNFVRLGAEILLVILMTLSARKAISS
jgi:hypothetical protein